MQNACEAGQRRESSGLVERHLYNHLCEKKFINSNPLPDAYKT